MTQPKFATQDKNGRRLYRDPVSGKRVPSVTTVMGMKAKPLLVPWAAKMSAEFAVENWEALSDLPREDRIQRIKSAYRVKSQDAADLGDSIHIYAEAFMKKENLPDYPADAFDSIANLLAWLDVRQPKLIAAEVSMFSERGYAGTFDALVEMDGEVWLLDWKTGKGVYDETGMQLAALHFADRVLAEEPIELPKATRFGVVHIRPDDCNLIEFTGLDAYFEQFLACLTLYQGEKK